MSSSKNHQDASEPKQRNQNLLLHIGINVLATAILFWFTVHDDEPLTAPLSEISMILRWAVIATIVAFLQFCWARGWKRVAFRRKRGGREEADISECPDCRGTGIYYRKPCDHRRLGT